MTVLTTLAAIFFSLFSTTVMSYITMATPIGPWIALTLTLLALFLFSFFPLSRSQLTESIVLSVSAGSIGGILATALGFSFPTLYFLAPELFMDWMAKPAYFAGVVTALSLTAGALGLWMAGMLEQRLIVEQNLAFPIGQLVYKMIAAKDQVRKTWQLFIGFVASALFGVLQSGCLCMQRLIPASITLFKAQRLGVFAFPAIALDLGMLPMLLAIGFVTGHVIAHPLLVGALARILVMDPINKLWFAQVDNTAFVLAFCSGLVLSGAVLGMVGMPQLLWKAVMQMRASGFSAGLSLRSEGNRDATQERVPTGVSRFEGLVIVGMTALFLSYFKFSVISQVYLVVVTLVCTYQIASIAGKIGLAQLGRFATFVMVPGMLLFGYDAVQLTLVATFVELCGGVATDALFGRKLGHLSGVSSVRIKRYQYLGLGVASIAAGLVFWILINHFGLGSEHLFATRAQSRKLLVQVRSFNVYILAVGFLFGYLLKVIKLNPMMVLGGLLMPINISLGLVIGGYAAYLTRDREAWYPFWSGVFAANSLWMVIWALL